MASAFTRPKIDFDLRAPGGLARLFALNKAEFGGHTMSTPGPEAQTGREGGAAGQEGQPGAQEGAQGAPGPETGSEGQEGPTEGQGEGKGSKQAVLADLARERQKRHELEAQFEQLKTGMLSALGVKTQADEMTPEALMQKLNEFQAKQDERDQKAADRVKRSAIVDQASQMSFHNPDDAVARIDLGKVKINANEEVDGTYIKSELERIAREYPYLIKVNGTAQDAGIGSVGAAESPGKGKARLEGYYNAKK